MQGARLPAGSFLSTSEHQHPEKWINVSSPLLWLQSINPALPFPTPQALQQEKSPKGHPFFVLDADLGPGA